jgi:hypothetical protein
MSTRTILIVGACIVAITIYYLMQTVKNTEKADKFIEELTNKNVVRDNLYFKFKDENGNVSMVHDSGIKPSAMKSSEKILMKVVKYEYNDGIEKILGRPVELAIGQNIYHLVTNIKLTPDQVQEKRDHYIVSINNLWK